ncbi:MAG: hypothetical protein KAS32_22975 [Candidatus Peribacteraceae bacterium]|nr:hypothetical protein [Candidatus Peribacteraceae bacterium]
MDNKSKHDVVQMKIGQAVKSMEGTIGVVTDVFENMCMVKLATFKELKALKSEYLTLLPNHIITNPYAKIMKAIIWSYIEDKDTSKERKVWKWKCVSRNVHTFSIEPYTTKQEARKSLCKWAEDYQINIELMEN